MNKLITTIACLICCIVYTQAQNKDNMLSKKEQSIAAISMYAARGNQDSLKVILARGLDCGLTVSEEKEVLTQLYAYCGFPRSMGALVTLMNLTKERAAQGIKDEAGREPSPVKSSDMFVVGGQNQLKLFGRPALGEVLTFAPALDQFLKAHLTCSPCGNPVFEWYTSVPMLLHGIPAIVLAGYGTGTIVRSCLARPVPPTKQILFYPTGAGGHWVTFPVYAFSVVYGTIRPSSLLSI